MATSTTPQPYTAGRPENSTTSVDANKSAHGVSSNSSVTRCSNPSFLSPGAFGSSVSPCLHSRRNRLSSLNSVCPS